MADQDIKQMVKDRYGKAALAELDGAAQVLGEQERARILARLEANLERIAPHRHVCAQGHFPAFLIDEATVAMILDGDGSPEIPACDVEPRRRRQRSSVRDARKNIRAR